VETALRTVHAARAVVVCSGAWAASFLCSPDEGPPEPPAREGQSASEPGGMADRHPIPPPSSTPQGAFSPRTRPLLLGLKHRNVCLSRGHIAHHWDEGVVGCATLRL